MAAEELSYRAELRDAVLQRLMSTTYQLRADSVWSQYRPLPGIVCSVRRKHKPNELASVAELDSRSALHIVFDVNDVSVVVVRPIHNRVVVRVEYEDPTLFDKLREALEPDIAFDQADL